ncbi:MAG: hypothetical protein LAQ30_14700 [Acidobacteriia bacterium]|nr:hypothetical protein [Terriglobia bacterium]
MIRADSASIRWTDAKKQWTIAIHVGAEVIKRAPGKRIPRDAADDALRAAALETAKDDGYDVPADRVDIGR